MTKVTPVTMTKVTSGSYHTRPFALVFVFAFVFAFAFAFAFVFVFVFVFCK
jgi:hypothetical protein